MLPGNHVSLVLSAGHIVLATSAVVGLTFIPKIWCINFGEKNFIMLFIVDGISLARSKGRESVYYQ